MILEAPGRALLGIVVGIIVLTLVIALIVFIVGIITGSSTGMRSMSGRILKRHGHHKRSLATKDNVEDFNKKFE